MYVFVQLSGGIGAHARRCTLDFGLIVLEIYFLRCAECQVGFLSELALLRRRNVDAEAMLSELPISRRYSSNRITKPLQAEVVPRTVGVENAIPEISRARLAFNPPLFY